MHDHRSGNDIGAYPYIILILLIMVLVPSGAAADAMFRGNPEHTGVYEDGGIVATNTELWRFKCMESSPIVYKGFTFTMSGGSSPAVSNGVVYVGSYDNNLYAIDAITGKEKWRFKTGSEVASSPAVSNGVIYVGSLDNNLYAVDGVTGTEKWRFKTKGAVHSSPSVSNGVVYFGSRDSNLYAIDSVTGKEKWRLDLGGDYFDLSPAVSKGVVYVGGYDKNIYAIDAVTGKEKWRLALAFHSLAVSNGVVFVVSGEYLYAIDAITGMEKWRFTNDFWLGSLPAVSNNFIYVEGGYDNNVYAIDTVTGKEKWRFMTGEVTSSLVVSNGTIYVGSRDKNLYAIDSITGKEKWRFKTGGIVTSSPVVSNGVIYFGSDDGYLYAVGVPSSQVNTPTDVATPRIQNSPQTNLPSKSGNSTPVTKTTDLSSSRIQSIYWIVVLILLIGILYEGWKAVKPGK